MNNTSHLIKTEGLGLFRFILLLSSLFPLFFIMAIKGDSFSQENFHYMYMVALYLLMFLPNLLLFFVCKYVKKYNPIRRKIEARNNIIDCKERYSAYILSIILPLYQNDIYDSHSFLIFLGLLIFIIIIFYMFNLYYLNVLFYIYGFKILEIIPQNDSFEPCIIITKKNKYDFHLNEDLNCYAITDTLLLEK